MSRLELTGSSLVEYSFTVSNVRGRLECADGNCWLGSDVLNENCETARLFSNSKNSDLYCNEDSDTIT